MRLLSWNIQWGCGCYRHVSFARIVDVIRRMGDFDVVSLQQVAVTRLPAPRHRATPRCMLSLVHRAAPCNPLSHQFSWA